MGMLILARKHGESVIINGNVRVTVLPSSSGNRIELGFEAPLEVTIDREEIFLRKDRERKEQARARANR
jgi:carbon storage regulator